MFFFKELKYVYVKSELSKFVWRFLEFLYVVDENKNEFKVEREYKRWIFIFVIMEGV